MEDIRKFPKQESRVETGPIQFGDDWPGAFIRGDEAGYYAFVLRSFLDSDAGEELHPLMERSPLENLYFNLKSCMVKHGKIN